MHKLKFICPKKDQELYTEILFAKDALSISEKEAKEKDCVEIEAFFDDIIDIDHIPFEKKWVKVKDSDWKKQQTLKVGDYTIICSNTVFGDGEHATTELCKEALTNSINECRKNKKNITVLDIGTGSGILAIWASYLGATKCDAIDVDEEAVAITKENIANNNITNVKVDVKDITKWEPKEKYDIIIANIQTETLEIIINKIATWPLDNTTIILSGIGEMWHKEFSEKLNKNFTISALKIKDSWGCFIIKKRN